MYVDAMVSLDAVNRDLAYTIEKLAPYGIGNPQPLIAFPHVYITGATNMRGGHVRCFLKMTNGNKTIKAIAFRADDKPLGQAMLSGSAQPYHALGHVVVNRWQGRESTEVHLTDLAPVQ